MLLGGDEMGRTQGGNNNAYCQDNEISWFNWDLDENARSLIEFTSRLAQLRREHPALRRRNFFQGRPIYGSEIHDISWFRPDGEAMADEEWTNAWSRTVGMRLGGEALGELDAEGNTIEDENFLILFNAHAESVEFKLPVRGAGAGWRPLIDTNRPENGMEEESIDGGGAYVLAARSVALFIEVERRESKRKSA